MDLVMAGRQVVRAVQEMVIGKRVAHDVVGHPGRVDDLQGAGWRVLVNAKGAVAGVHAEAFDVK